MTFAFSVNKDWFQIHENLQERLCAWLCRGLYAMHAVKVPSKEAPERLQYPGSS